MTNKELSDNIGKQALVHSGTSSAKNKGADIVATMIRQSGLQTDLQIILDEKRSFEIFIASIEKYVAINFLNTNHIDKAKFDRFLRFSQDELYDLATGDFALYKSVIKARGRKTMTAYITGFFAGDKGINISMSDDSIAYFKNKDREFPLPEKVVYNLVPKTPTKQRQEKGSSSGEYKFTMSHRDLKIPTSAFYKIASKNTKERVVQRLIDHLDQAIGGTIDVIYKDMLIQDVINCILTGLQIHLSPVLEKNTDISKLKTTDYTKATNAPSHIFKIVNDVLYDIKNDMGQIELYTDIVSSFGDTLTKYISALKEKLEAGMLQYPDQKHIFEETLGLLDQIALTSTNQAAFLRADDHELWISAVIKSTIIGACAPDLLEQRFAEQWIKESTDILEKSTKADPTPSTIPQKSSTKAPTINQNITPQIKEISATAQAAIEVVLGSVADPKKDHLKKILEKIWRKQTNLDRSKLVAGFDIAMDQTQVAQRQEMAKDAGFFFYTKGEKHNVVQKQQPTVSEDKLITVDKNESVGDNIIKPLVYPTLEIVKADPSLLTSEKLVQIFKEMGYRFLNEEDFKKEAQDLGLDQEGNALLVVKKKLIDLLRMSPSDARENRRSHKGGVNYQRLDLNNGRRLVKQRGTILWIMKDWDKYNSRVADYFVSKGRDFDKELGPRDSIAEQQKHQPKPDVTEDKKKHQTIRLTEFNQENSSDFPNAC